MKKPLVIATHIFIAAGSLLNSAVYAGLGYARVSLIYSLVAVAAIVGVGLRYRFRVW